ncbi:MAG: PIG-L family deacetylase [Anaerolineae bacterium]|nr:PIG-L family deacetylase [Anaerolineae bacterium]MDW8071233.1 PIG-L family deacetylase [Anaerolineae bacterium]
MPPSTSTAHRRLLGIFAHPDDESFGAGGTLAKYARSGVEVHVCTITDGAGGTYDPALLAASGVATLVELRRRELACACRVLGAQLWMLGYRDSGMPGSPDNLHPDSLLQAPMDEVIAQLVRVIRHVRPQVIITHEFSGGYNHPDHVKTSQAVYHAFRLAGDASYSPPLPDAALPPWPPMRLYHLVVPRSAIRWFSVLVWLRGQNPRRFGVNGDIDLTRLGVPDRQIHVRLQLDEYLEVKQQASACHRSQGGGAMHWPSFLGRRAMRYEHFIQVLPSGARRHRDLFEGLEAVL